MMDRPKQHARRSQKLAAAVVQSAAGRSYQLFTLLFKKNNYFCGGFIHSLESKYVLVRKQVFHLDWLSLIEAVLFI